MENKILRLRRHDKKGELDVKQDSAAAPAGQEEVNPAVTLIMHGFTGPVPYPYPFLGKLLSSRYVRKGNRSAESNNCPISLITILCKMCEHIVHFADIGHLS